MPVDCHKFQFHHNFWHSEDYLSRVVRELHPDQSQKQIYYAASHASACVRQAKSFLANADKVDASLQALLYYYGLLNWYKALIHLFDLSYPATTSVLQHGVSVRRTKRASYHLHSEAVYVYKEGVIQSASSLAGITLPQRIGFGDAIGFSPGLREVVDTLYPSSQHLYPVLRVGGGGEGDHAAHEADGAVTGEHGAHEAHGADGGHGSHGARDELGPDGQVLKSDRPGPHSMVPTRSRKAQWFVPRRCASQRGLTVEEWMTEYIEAGVASPIEPSTASGIKVTVPSVHAMRNAGDSADRSSLKGWLELPYLTTSHPWLLGGADGYGARLGELGECLEHAYSRQAALTTHASNHELLLCNAQPLPNWVCEFVILFCLASIVRYNPLEWSDIERWHNEIDALFIESYLKGCPGFVADCVERLYGDMLTAYHSRPDAEA